MTVASRSAVAIVPVRIGSQRLPGKAMLAESGRPLFLHTWQRAVESRRFDGGVYIATDSDEVADATQSVGGLVLRTSETPRTGSERCAEAAAQLPDGVGYVVDIQGDWPEVEPADLDALVDCLRGGAAPTATLAVPLRDEARFADPNVVKVVRGLDGKALYFSRATIPYPRDPSPLPRLRHVGVYAFTRETLARIPALPSSGLAEAESLEQLRFLENGIAMQVLDARGEPWGIETRTDYDAFLHRLRSGARGGGGTTQRGGDTR
ncbi:MAG: 3-deoxy-manno-octulosonate cytidylyltransferase [Planctomycetes bacterium]|nr:3-deoxy-manno-octulosonate cytidylyltransferase [Planctomycetota bacterium]